MREIDLGPIKAAIAEVDAQLKNPLPTAPVGTPIIWYPQGDIQRGIPVAGVVTLVDGPGKITVTTFPPRSFPTHKTAALHEWHPQHKDRHNHISINCGAWGYPKDVAIPKQHFQPHVDQLNAKRASLVAQLEQATAVKLKQESPA